MHEYSKGVFDTYASRRKKVRLALERLYNAFDKTIDPGDPKPQFYAGIEFPTQISNALAEQGRNPLDITEEAIHLGLMILRHNVHQRLPDSSISLIKIEQINPASPQDLNRPKREDVQFDSRTEKRLRHFLPEHRFQDWFLRSLAIRMRIDDMNLLHLGEYSHEPLDAGKLKRLIADRTLTPVFLRPSPLPQSEHIQSDIPRGMRRIFPS